MTPYYGPDHPEPPELVEFLTAYPPEVQQTALECRLALLNSVPPSSEIFYDATNAVCAGVMFTHSVRDSFVNLAVYSDHVTLIFQYGAGLPDPHGLLKGSGNQVRHIRLKGAITLQDPHVQELIRHATDRATRPTEPLELVTIVKVMKGPKRRPLPK